MTQQDWRVKTAILKHRLSKFNPNHDEAGRFSSGPGGGGKGKAAIHPPNAFKGGDRVRMPNGVMATVQGAEGHIVEGALAEGDDGKTYFTASMNREAASVLGMKEPELVPRGHTFQGKPVPHYPRSYPSRSEPRPSPSRSERERQHSQLPRNKKPESGPDRFGTKPRSMSDLHLQITESIQRDMKMGGGGKQHARIANNVSTRTGVKVTAKQVKRVAQELKMERKQKREARRAAASTTESKRPSTIKPFKPGEKQPSVERTTRSRKILEGAQAWRPWGVAKFNPYHDEIGQFTESGGNSTGAPGGYPGGRPVKGGKPSGSKDKKGGGKPGSHKSNPIKTSDVNEALKLLSEGKQVELESVEQVSTLVKRLNQIVKDAEKKGDKAPSYDLCKVSVANTNIFCAEHKDIPRLKMPQLKGETVKGSKAAGMKKDKKGEVDVAKQFIQKMKDDGVKVTTETVKANTLRASQSELVGSKVAGMVASARAGKFDPEAGTIYVSKDGYIIDGHHRWAATIGLDAGSGSLGDRTINVVRINKPILEVLKEANDFTREIGIKPKEG